MVGGNTIMPRWLFINDLVFWQRVKMLSLVTGLAIAAVAVPMPLRPVDPNIVYVETFELE